MRQEQEMNVTESEGSAILQRAQLEPSPMRGVKGGGEGGVRCITSQRCGKER